MSALWSSRLEPRAPRSLLSAAPLRNQEGGEGACKKGVPPQGGGSDPSRGGSAAAPFGRLAYLQPGYSKGAG